MKSSTRNSLILISLLTGVFSSQASHETPTLTGISVDVKQRFIKLDSQGMPTTGTTWQCVLDTHSALIWEVKTTQGLRDRNNTYTWYNSNPQTNGGFFGYPNGGKCNNLSCDSRSYAEKINEIMLCGYSTWRLPSREELRSLVDYGRHFPDPTISTHFFPNTVPQFYWSSTPEAMNKDSAWGIGFTFGFDYSYFKSDLGYIRLVTNYGEK